MKIEIGKKFEVKQIQDCFVRRLCKFSLPEEKYEYRFLFIVFI